MFLPRKEYNVDPPHHSMDHGPVGIVKQEKTGEVKKKRRSMSDLFKRKGDGKSESETEVYKNFAKHGEDVGKEEMEWATCMRVIFRLSCNC